MATVPGATTAATPAAINPTFKNLGSSYTATNGQKRTASPGNVFYQANDATGTINERPGQTAGTGTSTQNSSNNSSNALSNYINSSGDQYNGLLSAGDKAGTDAFNQYQQMVNRQQQDSSPAQQYTPADSTDPVSQSSTDPDSRN